MEIPQWQHELARYYRQVKLVSYFLNNAVKKCLYRLKILENIEIGHFFQIRIFFHLSSNLHTSCFSAFNAGEFCCGTLFFFHYFSLNSCLSFLVYCTYILWKTGAVKNKNNTAEKEKAIFQGIFLYLSDDSKDVRVCLRLVFE